MKRTGIPGRGEREGFRLGKLVAAYRVLVITKPGPYLEGTLVLHSGGSGGIRVRSTPLRIVERTISHREQSVLCLHIVCRTCKFYFFCVCVYSHYTAGRLPGKCHGSGADTVNVKKEGI